MGCVNTFIYKSKDFNHINWYSERIDRRLEEITIIKNSIKSENYILKEIEVTKKEIILEKKKQFSEAFKKNPNLILQIEDIVEKCDIVNCETNKKKNKKKKLFLKIQHFDKDLYDDLNIKSLKDTNYNNFEIWNLIYFSIFVFSILEEHKIKIEKIKRINFLIKKKKLIYFCENLFSNKKEQNIIDEKMRDRQFKDRLEEFSLFILTTIVVLNNNKEIIELKKKSKKEIFEILLKKSKNKIFDNLYKFIKDILIDNANEFKSFVELRIYLIKIYETFDYHFFDKKYIKDYCDN